MSEEIAGQARKEEGLGIFNNSFKSHKESEKMPLLNTETSVPSSNERTDAPTIIKQISLLLLQNLLLLRHKADKPNHLEGLQTLFPAGYRYPDPLFQDRRCNRKLCKCTFSLSNHFYSLVN